MVEADETNEADVEIVVVTQEWHTVPSDTSVVSYENSMEAADGSSG